MRASLVINQTVCAAAVAGVVFASHQGAAVSSSLARISSARTIKVDATAVQIVNRAAKGDRWKSFPKANPESATTPDRPHNRGIIASRYVMAAVTLVGAEPWC